MLIVLKKAVFSLCVVQVARRFEGPGVFRFLAVQIYNGLTTFSRAVQGKEVVKE